MAIRLRADQPFHPANGMGRIADKDERIESEGLHVGRRDDLLPDQVGHPLGVGGDIQIGRSAGVDLARQGPRGGKVASEGHVRVIDAVGGTDGGHGVGHAGRRRDMHLGGPHRSREKKKGEKNQKPFSHDEKGLSRSFFPKGENFVTIECLNAGRKEKTERTERKIHTDFSATSAVPRRSLRFAFHRGGHQ